jgi:hypothetical protein
MGEDVKHPLVQKIMKKIIDEGLNPNDNKCTVTNTICPSRLSNNKCRYTRIQRALMFFDCAYE